MESGKEPSALPGAPNLSHPRRADLPALRLQADEAGRMAPHLRAFRLLVRGVFLLFLRVKIRGLGNVPSTPAIICANHLSWADPFLVLLFFPPQPRIYVLSDHNAVSRTGFRAAMMNFLQIAVPLDPGKSLQALQAMEGVLRRGGSLLIFPEGAPPACVQEGVLRELEPGAAYLSALSGVPLLPVGISDTSELWLRRTLRMRVGRPISPARLEGDRRVRARQMTVELARSVEALIPPPGRQPRVRLLRRWLTGLFA